MEQALKGIKVLDLTRVLAGPYCTMILADMGADVIKVEAPIKGDDSRQFGPYVNGESAYFMSINRNKRSITLNLKQPEAQKEFFKLIKSVDVITENFKPGTMEKLGLGYEVLKAINPQIIYAATSGFGHTGPYSARPAYDGVVQAMGGIMSITGQKGGKPTRVGPSVGDIMAGMFTAIGILGALHYRTENGIGQKIDVSMLDCQVAVLENAISRYMATGISPKPEGNRHASIVPFEPFDTEDGEIMIAVGNDSIWHKFCTQIQRADLISHELFASNPLRSENYELLSPIIKAIIKTKKTLEWQAIFDENGIPNGPINNIESVVNDPQVNHREMILEMDHPIAHKVKIPGIPIKMSVTQGAVYKASPVLGEDTESILKTMNGLTDEEIETLKTLGAI
ncbi:CaiB/BaiF CoA-transferase family protein [Fusibacter sp. 3D3]|uniref:CaiB/BaiF CoA transferase family protein n=1 Tax=Fusibacter sp. 3D3 TaxID=1048380 RepID=UPI000852AD2B|nr:CaiB/BaiF CoA-transferase family protein [Fusibacter sp. 3D3]GAU77080.1 CAIB/BAIF family protein [Fusibacter sp. 3D3]